MKKLGLTNKLKPPLKILTSQINKILLQISKNNNRKNNQTQNNNLNLYLKLNKNKQ